MKVLEANPSATQREVAEALGISPGKVNYCPRAFMEKGGMMIQMARLIKAC